MTQQLPALTINVNLNALLGGLQESLQTTINLVAVALNANAPDSTESLRLPVDSLSMEFSARTRWSSDESVEKHRTWAISNGLRDAVEGVSHFIEDAHRVLSVWSLIPEGEGRTTYGEYQHALDGTAFHRLGLPDKLSHLRSEHGISISAELERHLLSVNNARNCLVHRRGIVSARDFNGQSRLVVEWRKIHLFIQDEDGEHELIFGKKIEKQGSICMRLRDESKSFGLGDRVSFSVQEFAEICWSLWLFGSDLVRGVSAARPGLASQDQGNSRSEQ